jgi:hypothetical protein
LYAKLLNKEKLVNQEEKQTCYFARKIKIKAIGSEDL